MALAVPDAIELLCVAASNHRVTDAREVDVVHHLHLRVDGYVLHVVTDPLHLTGVGHLIPSVDQGRSLILVRASVNRTDAVHVGVVAIMGKHSYPPTSSRRADNNNFFAFIVFSLFGNIINVIGVQSAGYGIVF